MPIVRLPWLVCCLILSFPVFALDKSSLWLPKKYKEWMPWLEKSAMLAESSGRCQKVLKGRLQSDHSTLEEPVFVVFCRDAQGASYASIFSADKSAGEEPSVTQQESASGSVRMFNAIGSKRTWDLCYSALEKKTEFMSGVKIVRDSRGMEAEVNSLKTPYFIDFDAKDPLGNRLKYRAHCMVMPSMRVEVDVTSRPKEQ